MNTALNKIFNGDIKKPMPILSFPGIQLMGITVRELVQSPENQALCIKLIADRFDCAASVTLMDLSVEAEAFGSEISFSDHEVPCVIGSLINDEDSAERLIVPKVGQGRTGVCIKAISLAKKSIIDRPVFAGVIGPFSLAGRLMGMTEIMVNALTEPDLTHIVVSKASEFILSYARSLKAVGADGIIIAEPAAGLVSPEVCDEFSSRYLKKIVASLKDDNFSVIYHNCGNTIPLLDSIQSINADGYHFGNAVDLSEVLNKMPGDLPVFGNLSPSEHFSRGTVQSVKAATLQMLEKANAHKNYIPSSGCDIPPSTPLENIDAFFEAANEYYGNQEN